MIEDKDFAEEIAGREPQQQAVVLGNGRIKRFESAQFVAHLKSDMKFTKNGDVELTLSIPHEFKHLVFPMSDAFGLPLSIDVRVWAPFTEATQDI